MKKLLLTGAALMALSFSVKAQETLLETTFGTTNAELTEQAANYLIGDIDGDGDSWTFYLDPDFATLGFTGIAAGSASFLVDEETEELTLTVPENILITPIVNLTDYVTAELTFKIGGLLGQNSVMNYKLLVLTEDQLTDADFDIATAVPVLTDAVQASGSGNVTFDLTQYAGQNIAIVFVHTESTGIGYLLVDDIKVTASDVAGVETNLLSKVAVYPNPATNVVNVANAGIINNVSLADLNGRTVKSVKVGSLENAQVNISDLASGVYMMTISSDKGTSTKKIVKN